MVSGNLPFVYCINIIIIIIIIIIRAFGVGCGWACKGAKWDRTLHSPASQPPSHHTLTHSAAAAAALLTAPVSCDPTFMSL